MHNSYSVATVLTFLPAAHINLTHTAALRAANFATIGTADKIYLHTDAPEGPRAVNIDLLVNQLRPLGTTIDQNFINALEAHTVLGEIDWTVILQLVLRDLPERVPHIDVTGSYWSNKVAPGNFGGFAVRVTRTAILIQESAIQYFDRLSREAGSVVERPAPSTVSRSGSTVIDPRKLN